MTTEPGRSSPVPPNRGEPVTEAGKAMVAYLRKDWVRDFDSDVAAVEAEAAALERERLRTQVKAMPGYDMDGPDGRLLDRRHVLSLLDEPTP